MKIVNTNSFYKFTTPLTKINGNLNTVKNNLPIASVQKQPSADVVSFSGKNYNAESILNPTNHCAYCGCKVYDEQQIDSIAKEMLASKADRLEGKIKSVLEKLTEAKHSQELTLAKKTENDDEIRFFKKFMELASTRSFLKGEAIFKQVYDIDKDEALETIKENLRPLQKTIDHVSPQNLEQENNSSDINLVESCYCCNHDLKQGMPFDQFYAMFPSIKNNMPSDKFQYAISNILDSSQENILKRLSATNLLGHLQRLFAQRTEAVSYLDSIDFRIQGCKTSISDTVDSCKSEISEKQAQISELNAKLAELKKDPEYNAIVKRAALSDKIDTTNEVITQLSAKHTRTSNSINEIRNNISGGSSKKNKKRQSEIKSMSKEEATQKIDEMKILLEDISSQMQQKQADKTGLELQIKLLDEEFPTIEMVQQEKSKAERIYGAHNNLRDKRAELEKNQIKYNELDERYKELDSFVKLYPEGEFNIEDYSDEDKALYDKYKTMEESLEYINTHPNGGSVKVCIHSAAKDAINSSIQDLKKEKVIADYSMFTKKKEQTKILANMAKQIENIKQEISNNENQIKIYEQITENLTQQEALDKSKKCSEDIRRLTEKANQVKIPQIIAKLQAEIILIQSTINDLQTKEKEIEQASIAE